MHDKALRDAREEQQELDALHRLDEECVHQQRAGNYLKAFDCMERALVLRRHFFGVESEEVIQACRALAEMCNLLAMSFLQQDNYPVTIDLLKKAEVLTQRHHPVERATTLNNFACYYRRLGKLHAAMTSLKHALRLEKKLNNVRNAADTQLNMCAVLSQLGKHQEALEHAQEALITLQEGFIHSTHTIDVAADNSTGDTSSARLDRISVMCISYHNIGVEQEFLKEYAESVASYKKGVGLAEQYLGGDHSITTTIRNSYLAAKRMLATKAKVQPTRGQKSPKVGAKLFSSPRSGSLRMPSPLVKEKDHHSGFPTPRSIITDALSRAPLSALPPLEVQNPPSASTKKKKTAPGEVKNSAPPLSPTDPFFSPRFRFDDDTTQPKAKTLASITNPRSTAPTNVELRTLPSSSGKRERRKSSVKKPQSTAGTRKQSAGDRVKTEPTPRATESINATALHCPTDGISGEVADSFIGGSSKENMAAEPNGEVQELASADGTDVAPTLTAVDVPDISAQSAPITGTGEEHELTTERQNVTAGRTISVDQKSDRIIPTTLRSEETSHDIEDTVLDDAIGAGSKVPTSVIDKVTEADLPSSHTDASPEDGNTPVDSPLKQQEAIKDLDSDGIPVPGVVKNDDSTESDAVDISDEVTVVSDSTEEAAHGEQSHHVVQDDRHEDNAEVSIDFADPGVQDEGAMNTGSSVDEAEANLEGGNPHYSENTSDVESAHTYVPDGQSALESADVLSAESVLDLENAGIYDTNEEPSNMNPEAAIENCGVDEDGETATLSEDQPQLSSADVGEVDNVTPDGIFSANETDCHEEIESAVPVERLTHDHPDLPEEGLIEAREQFFDQGEKEPQSMKGADEFAAAAIDYEAQEGHLIATEDHPLSEEFDPTTDSYEVGGYYDENNASGQENAYSYDVNSVEYLPSDQEAGDQTEQVYEQHGYEDVHEETSSAGDAQLDWSEVDQSESVVAEHAAEYIGYSQDAPVQWLEGQQSYDENAESVGDRQHKGEASEFPSNVVNLKTNAIDIATNAPDAAAPE
ncbi:hypothetical protein PC112_g5113 [Phytophthora cactorum]|nr:hypothetical protein PC112_g5113 [Phytophthora cactorum]